MPTDPTFADGEPEREVGRPLPTAAAPAAMIVAMTGTVLLIDDDAAFRRLARRMLAGSGLRVVGEAASVAAAAAAAERLRPEAALVDVMLPDGDGVALARELAALPWAPRVVLTSCSADAAGPDEIAESGVVAFVPKPELPNVGLGALLGGG